MAFPKICICICICFAACLAQPRVGWGETLFLKDDTPEQAKWRALRKASEEGGAIAPTAPKKAAPPKEKSTLEAAKDSFTVRPRYDSSAAAGGLKAGMDIPVSIGGNEDSKNTTRKAEEPVKMHVRPEGSVDTKGGAAGGVGLSLPF